MTNRKEEAKAPPKVYMIIENKKEYIDPEMVKKHKLENLTVSPISGRKLYTEGS